MKKNMPRILMILSGLFLLTLFIFPMWQIILIAPQYPDGVALHIFINKIGGDTPSALQNINILNHYIGMKYIEPDSIKELQYFPYIILALSALAFIAAAINRKFVFLGWAVLMIIIAILGMYDFYLWEYDYGHNLSDTAPIKVPGASFQPPLIGTKLILNFIAKSLPHIGGYFAMGSILTAIGAWWLKSKTKKDEDLIPVDSSAKSNSRMQSIALAY